jgi:dihydrofolate reductase
MRKLKLQIQMSLDGFIAGPNGEMDWMMWDWDAPVKEFVQGLNAPVDTIVMGRKLAEEFIPTWTGRSKDPVTADEFAHKMVNTKKIVFSKTLTKTLWENATIANDLIEDINRIKLSRGGDIIAYGGGTFVSALIEAKLIDEINLFFNPAAIGAGLPIFKNRTDLSLIGSHTFCCGIVVLTYEPKTK